MKITQEEKSKLEFMTNFIVEKAGLEKAARFFSGIRSSQDFLTALDRLGEADTEPLPIPELPVETGEGNKKQIKNGDEGDILPLPEMKF